MPDIWLTRLPGRKPAKLTIAVSPDLHLALENVARFYANTYGQPEPLANLVPAMLASSPDSDRDFARRRKKARR